MDSRNQRQTVVEQVELASKRIQALSAVEASTPELSNKKPANFSQRVKRASILIQRLAPFSEPV